MSQMNECRYRPILIWPKIHMKEAEQGNNAMRPPQQQKEFLATDGDDVEKCKEQKACLSRLGKKSEHVAVTNPSHQTWRKLNNFKL
jgi:hypothetical protein